jgi:hypothetical protein
MSRTGAWLACGLVVGAVIRLLLLPVPGSPDVGSWKIWAFAGAYDATSLYGVGGDPPERRLMRWRGGVGTTEYPPLATYEISAVGRIYRAIDPTFRDTTTLTALIKAPGLVAEIAFVVAMLTWGRRRLGEAPARWIALACWLNPAVVINGAALGYLDAQMAFPATLALVAAAVGTPAAAGALIAVAILTKAQALFVAPTVALAALPLTRSTSQRWNALLWFSGAAAIVATLVLLPIVARGAWANMVQAVGRLAAHDMVSGQGLNVWWIITWIVRSLDSLDLGWRVAFTEPVRVLGISRFMEVGYPNPKPIGAAIVCVAITGIAWRSRRGLPLSASALVAAWCVYVYAMFSAQVHENHFYLAVPLLAVAAGLDRTLRGLFWAISVMTAFSMYIFYGFGAPWSPEIDTRLTVIDMTVVAAFVNVGLFVWLTRRTLGATAGS